MRTTRYLVIAVIVLVASVMVWSIASARQDASSTTEPSASATAEAPAAPAQGTPFLGVSLQDTNSGVTIAQVVNGSGAAAAGLQVGDVITAVNGTAVKTAAEVAKLVQSMKVGDTVTITYTRGSSSLTATATLGTRPANMPSTIPNLPQRPVPPNNGNGNRNNNGRNPQNNYMQMLPFFFGTGHLGVTYVTVDPQVVQQHNLTVTDGALVTAVEANSPAATAGLKVNDIITAVEGDKLDQKRTLFYRLLPYRPNDSVTLTISRDGQSMDIKVTLGQQQTPRGDFGFQFGAPNGGFHFFHGPNGGFGFGFPFGNRNGAPGQNAPQAQPTPEATPNM